MTFLQKMGRWFHLLPTNQVMFHIAREVFQLFSVGLIALLSAKGHQDLRGVSLIFAVCILFTHVQTFIISNQHMRLHNFLSFMQSFFLYFSCTACTFSACHVLLRSLNTRAVVVDSFLAETLVMHILATPIGTKMLKDAYFTVKELSVGYELYNENVYTSRNTMAYLFQCRTLDDCNSKHYKHAAATVLLFTGIQLALYVLLLLSSEKGPTNIIGPLVAEVFTHYFIEHHLTTLHYENDAHSIVLAAVIFAVGDLCMSMYTIIDVSRNFRVQQGSSASGVFLLHAAKLVTIGIFRGHYIFTKTRLLIEDLMRRSYSLLKQKQKQKGPFLPLPASGSNVLVDAYQLIVLLAELRTKEQHNANINSRFIELIMYSNNCIDLSQSFLQYLGKIYPDLECVKVDVFWRQREKEVLDSTAACFEKCATNEHLLESLNPVTSEKHQHHKDSLRKNIYSDFPLLGLGEDSTDSSLGDESIFEWIDAPLDTNVRVTVRTRCLGGFTSDIYKFDEHEGFPEERHNIKCILVPAVILSRDAICVVLLHYRESSPMDKTAEAMTSICRSVFDPVIFRRCMTPLVITPHKTTSRCGLDVYVNTSDFGIEDFICQRIQILLPECEMSNDDFTNILKEFLRALLLFSVCCDRMRDKTLHKMLTKEHRGTIKRKRIDLLGYATYLQTIQRATTAILNGHLQHHRKRDPRTLRSRILLTHTDDAARCIREVFFLKQCNLEALPALDTLSLESILSLRFEGTEQGAKESLLVFAHNFTQELQLRYDILRPSLIMRTTLQEMLSIVDGSHAYYSDEKVTWIQRYCGTGSILEYPKTIYLVLQFIRRMAQVALVSKIGLSLKRAKTLSHIHNDGGTQTVTKINHIRTVSHQENNPASDCFLTFDLKHIPYYFLIVLNTVLAHASDIIISDTPFATGMTYAIESLTALVRQHEMLYVEEHKVLMKNRLIYYARQLVIHLIPFLPSIGSTIFIDSDYHLGSLYVKVGCKRVDPLLWEFANKQPQNAPHETRASLPAADVENMCMPSQIHSEEIDNIQSVSMISGCSSSSHTNSFMSTISQYRIQRPSGMQGPKIFMKGYESTSLDVLLQTPKTLLSDLYRASYLRITEELDSCFAALKFGASTPETASAEQSKSDIILWYTIELIKASAKGSPASRIFEPFVDLAAYDFQIRLTTSPSNEKVVLMKEPVTLHKIIDAIKSLIV